MVKAIKHKKSLQKLKNTDPEFYHFLEENDKSLLNFNEEDSSDENETEEEDQIHRPPKEDELEVNSDEDDFEDENFSRSDKHVTLKMVQDWQEQLSSDKSVGTISVIVKAFHAALVSVTANKEEDDQPVEYIVEGSSVFNAVIQLCVLELQPAIVRFLKLPTSSSALSKSVPSKSKKWPKVKSVLKSYFTDLLQIIKGVTSDHILCLMLKHIHQMSTFFAYYQQLVKRLLKLLVRLWSTANDDTVRVLAFLCILRITTGSERSWLEPALKMMYTAYISNSKFVSPKTLPGINFMRRSLTEILAIDTNLSYHHSFLYIRQLAIHLRNAITLHKKEFIQAVYNWQFVNSLYLWADLLSATHDKHQMNLLIFPLIQVIIGCIKLIPSAQYYPLRFHCCKMLITISKETGIYIPVVPFILEALTLTNFDKGNKTEMKPMDMTCLLRLSKSTMQDNNKFKDGIIDQVYKLLLDSLNNESHRLPFPELTLLPITQLKNFCKSCKINQYSQKLRSAINKIEENAKHIENERKKASFDLNDKKAVDAWERIIKTNGTPLNKFCEQLNKIYAQIEAKKITGNDKMGELKIPMLKKGKKRARNEDEPEFDLSSDNDSEDEDTLLKMRKVESPES